jgi:hypothetical protein
VNCYTERRVIVDTTVQYFRVDQITGARSPWRLKFVPWRLMYCTWVLSMELASGAVKVRRSCYFFGIFVHPSPRSTVATANTGIDMFRPQNNQEVIRSKFT